MRVEAVDSTRKRLTLGLVARKAAGGEDGEAAIRDELGGLQPGDLVRGTVEKVQKKQVNCGPLLPFQCASSAMCPQYQTQRLPTTVLMIALATQHDAEADADGSGGPAVFVISLPDGVRGRLEEAHLGDHPAAVAALAECIEPGTDLGDLLVLERLEARSSSLCTLSSSKSVACQCQ